MGVFWNRDPGLGGRVYPREGASSTIFPEAMRNGFGSRPGHVADMSALARRGFALGERPVAIDGQALSVLLLAGGPEHRQPADLRGRPQAEDDPPVARGRVTAPALGEPRQLPPAYGAAATDRIQNQMPSPPYSIRRRNGRPTRPAKSAWLLRIALTAASLP